MKKFYIVMLILCLLASSASADEQTPLRLGDNLPVSKYWQSNGISTTECFFAPFASDEDKLKQLQGDNAPDLFGLDTCHDDFEAFKEAGVLADLSGSAAIRAAVSRMRPEMQALLTTKDGAILGMPNAHVLYPLYWDRETWAAAGLTDADVPRSFTELLDSLEAWLDRAGDKSKKTVCVIAYDDASAIDDASRDAAWLVGLLLDIWEMQQRYAKESVCFDTPEFIALAERAADRAKAFSGRAESESPQKPAPTFL